MNEYREKGASLPEELSHIDVELPLLADILQRTRDNIERNSINPETYDTLLPVIQACHRDVKSLNDLISGLLPKPGDSSIKRLRKALSSLKEEKKIKQLLTQTRHHIQTLTYYHVSASAMVKSTLNALLFWLPYERDPSFVGRSDILQKLDSAFHAAHRAALFGIGGVGSVIS